MMDKLLNGNFAVGLYVGVSVVIVLFLVWFESGGDDYDRLPYGADMSPGQAYSLMLRICKDQPPLIYGDTELNCIAMAKDAAKRQADNLSQMK